MDVSPRGLAPAAARQRRFQQDQKDAMQVNSPMHTFDYPPPQLGIRPGRPRAFPLGLKLG